MKRSLFLSLLFLLLLTGCGEGHIGSEEPRSVTFYYASAGTEQLSADVAIGMEDRSVQVYTLNELMDVYFRGPVSDNLKSPFPSGTSLVGISETADGIQLTMSGEFFTLQGVDLSIASCCLANTVCDYVDVQQIVLVDEMRRISLKLHPDDFLLQNHYNQETGSIFTLYFLDKNNRYLIAETREVTLSENEAPELYVMRQLMLGPTSEELRPALPYGTELLDIKTEDGLCTVNFSEEFLDCEEDGSAYAVISGIVDTLTNLDHIASVKILVDGQEVLLGGVFSLEQPLRRNGAAIGPVRANGMELDVNVYVLTPDRNTEFSVPVRVKVSIAQPIPEAVADAIISYEAPYGLLNPIPYGTRLLGVSVSGSTCYVDLSQEFVPVEETEAADKAAVWSIVSTLTELDNISSVVLTIEGESHGLKYVDISEPLTKKDVSPD